MEERAEWMRNLFKALTSKQISRNKNFATFSRGWSRLVHHRYRVVEALKREADRLAEIPGTSCWVSETEGELFFHLQCPRMQYMRKVALQGYEWEWLGQQRSVQSMLKVKALDSRVHYND